MTSERRRCSDGADCRGEQNTHQYAIVWLRAADTDTSLPMFVEN